MPGSSTSLLHACAVALVLLATALQSTGADAQERARIEIVPQIAHADDIASATLTPDGAQMLTAGKDGTLKLWDLATMRELPALKVPNSGAYSLGEAFISFTEDSKQSRPAVSTRT